MGKHKPDVFLVDQEKQTYTTNHITELEAALLAKWHIPDVPYERLSGGEKHKIRLAKGLAKQPSLLLLDEPTNHLDLKSIELLIAQIRNYKGSIIVVSHDRYFLDQVVTNIWSIENTKLMEQKGNYSHYIKIREQRKLTLERQEVLGKLSFLTSKSPEYKDIDRRFHELTSKIKNLENK
jgi:macrolide transport system ATP-binding/permease protein